MSLKYSLSDNEKVILSCWSLLFIIAFLALLEEAPPSTPKTACYVWIAVTLVGGSVWLPYMGTLVHYSEGDSKICESSDSMGEITKLGDDWYIIGLKTSNLLSGLMGPYTTKQDAESEHKIIKQFLARQQAEKSRRQLLALRKKQIVGQ